MYDTWFPVTFAHAFQVKNYHTNTTKSGKAAILVFLVQTSFVTGELVH